MMTKRVNNKLSFHALKRGQQRGIRQEVMHFIMKEADRSAYVKGGCEALFITKRRRDYLVKNRTIEPSFAETLAKIVVIASGSNVLTAYHQNSRRIRS